MKNITTEQILAVVSAKKYKLRSGIMDFNPIGIRNSDAEANTFNDKVGYIMRDKSGIWISKLYDATTDPGLYYRLNPINVNGSAIIVPGQHFNCYKVGLHRGYKAFQQVGKMKYVRDNNKNKVLDFLYKVAGYKYTEEIAATNIHNASDKWKSQIVDKWSAGCQVLADSRDLKDMLQVAENCVLNYKKPNLFDYTLFEIEDFA